MRADVLHHADHFGKRVVRPVRLHLEPLADRRLARPCARRERLVDDDPALPGRSCSSKNRPASSRVPIARKYAGDTPRPSEVSLSQLRAVSSLYAYGDSDPLPVSGSCDVKPTSVTPGIARSCSSIWRRNAARASGRRILRQRQRDAEGEHAGRIEPGPHLLERREAPDHQARADQQNERERHLGDHQHAAQAHLRHRRRSGGAQRTIEIEARGPQGGNEAEEQRRQRAGADGEEQHGAVDAHGVEARQVRRIQPRQRPRAGPRERRARPRRRRPPAPGFRSRAAEASRARPAPSAPRTAISRSRAVARARSR